MPNISYTASYYVNDLATIYPFTNYPTPKNIDLRTE